MGLGGGAAQLGEQLEPAAETCGPAGGVWPEPERRRHATWNVNTHCRSPLRGGSTRAETPVFRRVRDDIRDRLVPEVRARG